MLWLFLTHKGTHTPCSLLRMEDKWLLVDTLPLSKQPVIIALSPCVQPGEASLYPVCSNNLVINDLMPHGLTCVGMN